ncbi:uncharacterized protein LOC144011105 [Festucalex cinctus]
MPWTSCIWRRPSSAFSVPASEDYLRELHVCWRDPGALSRPSADGRDLASMHDAASVGLDRMPAVEPAVASLIVSPEGTLRPSVRCPRPQCRVTDDLLTRAYVAGARAGRIGNSLAHLMLALSTSLQADSVEAAVSFSDAALQAFALMTREHGRLMSFLVQARRQVWLAQSPLSEASRRALRGVPVEPGELFGSAAVGALERTVKAHETRKQLSSLNRALPPQQGRPGARSGFHRFPQHWPAEAYGTRRPPQRPAEDFRSSARLPSGQPRAAGPTHRPSRAPRGRGARDCGLGAGRRTFFPPAAQLLACSCLGPMGGLHLDPRVRAAVPTPAYCFLSGQGDSSPTRQKPQLWTRSCPPSWPRTRSRPWTPWRSPGASTRHTSLSQRRPVLPRSAGLHSVCEGCSDAPAVCGHEGAAVPRRLAPLRAVAGSGDPGHLRSPVSCGPVGYQGQLAQVLSGPLSADGLHWCDVGHHGYESPPVSSPSRRCSSPPRALSRGQAVALRRLLAAFGQADVHDGCGPVGPADTAPTTEVAERLPLGRQVAPPPEAQGVPSVPPCPGTLEGEGSSIERRPAGCGPGPPRNSHHGCQPHGLGCCLAAQDGSGKLVCARQGRSHQCAGASGGALGTHTLLAIPERTACSHTVGQHHDRVSHKPSGRRQVRPSIGDLPAPSQVGCSPSGQSTGHLSAGGSEPARGLSLPSGSSSGRVAPPPRGGAHDLEQLRHGGGRSLCLRGLNPLPTLVFPERGHQPSGSGCSGAAVAGVPSLRLSAAPSDMAEASESSSGGAHAVADGPLLAGPDVVPPAPSTVLRRAVASPRQGGPVVSTGRSGLASRPTAPSRMCLATEGPQPLLTGCTESVTRTILNARAPSTRQQYANRWKLFVTWCGERGVDPVSCSIPTILDFLQSLLDKGRSQSTLKVYVAAISARHVGADGGSVGRHELVSLFLRGALRLCPRPAPRVPAWDLQLVLDGLCRPPFEPLAGADLLWVSRKTALLLAVASAKRVSDLHALSVSPECLRWHPDGAGVTLWPNTAFIPKVLSGSRSNQPLRLKRYVPTPADGGDRPELLCPVRALQCYIDATAGIRTSAQLFVCYGGPTKGSALSKQRLSHWVGDAIRHSYLLSGRPLPSGVRCHSTRSVATSWAALRGVSLEDICAAASWATPCTFSRFYSVDVASPHPLGVILGPAGASQ